MCSHLHLLYYIKIILIQSTVESVDVFSTNLICRNGLLFVLKSCFLVFGPPCGIQDAEFRTTGPSLSKADCDRVVFNDF